MAEQGKWDKSIKKPESTSCSLELALYELQGESDRRLSKYDLDKALPIFERLVKKYGKPLDRAKMTAEDKRQFDVANLEHLEPSRRELRLIYDLERIKIFARASEVIYVGDKQDITFSGGKMEALGKTVGEQVRSNTYDDQTIFAIGMWRKVNEKIPAGILKDWEEISKAPRSGK